GLESERVETFVADYKAPETTLDEVRTALAELDQTSQTKVQILVAELLAQARKANGDDGAWLRTRLTAGVVRIEAVGPEFESVPTNGATGPLAEWGTFIFERVSDRWGLDDV